MKAREGGREGKVVVAGGQAGGLRNLFAVYASVWFSFVVVFFLMISTQLVKTGQSRGTAAMEETSVLG